MRYDSEHKQRTRERLLAEAAKAVRAEGPHKVGVADLMARAGLTHGGFYAHFASKDDLIAEAVDQMFEEAGARTVRRLGEGRPPAEALRSYVDFYLSRSHRDTRTSGCPLPFLSADAPRLPEAARARYAEGAARLTEAFSDLLKQRGAPEPDSLATSVLAEMVGAVALARAEPDPARADAILEHSRASVMRRLGLEDAA
jgi:TetR/AcrR family transcriptional repressor of nem operon